MMNVKINFGGVFASVESKSELKKIANELIKSFSSQIQAAYAERLKELNEDEEPEVGVEAKPTTKKQSKTTGKASKQTANGKANNKAKAAADDDKKKVKQVKISSLTKAEVKKMGIKFVKYNDKCTSVLGDTKAIKDDLRKIVGWTKWMGEEKGWIINTKKIADVKAAFKAAM